MSTYFCELGPSLLTNSSDTIILHEQVRCMCLKIGSPNIMCIVVTYLSVLLPLNVYVLHLTQQRRRRASSATTASHTDVFTVHTCIMDMLNILGTVLTSAGVFTNSPDAVVVGLLPGMINMNGVMLFHTLTCVERHLAVVHPITYLGLKKTKGTRIRNVSIGAVWLMSFGGCLTLIFTILPFTVICLCLLGFNLIIVCFCSLSVLFVLVRPGPTDRSGRRQQVDQAKLRAFHTITVILCVLLLKFGGYILVFALYNTQVIDTAGKCYLWISLFWFCLPSNLVLPLLFLLRAGKLRCCETRQQSD